MNQETKVGLFLIVAVGAVLGAILFLGNVRLFERTDQYHIDFRDVEALPPKATVKIAGVDVGRVLRIRLVDGRARITLSISPDIALYENAAGRIGSTGVIGTRFVDLGTSSIYLRRFRNRCLFGRCDGVQIRFAPLGTDLRPSGNQGFR